MCKGTPMDTISLKRIAEALTSKPESGYDASGTSVRCITDAVCGVTEMLFNINRTLEACLKQKTNNTDPLILLAEEVNSKDIYAEFEQRQQNDRTWPFSNKLQCHWIKWTPVASGVLELYLPEGENCDMRGAISVGKALMPDVAIIVTYSGARLDTVYYRLGKR